MKFNEKHKAQKIINKIESGEFDEIDIDSLLQKLRAYSNGKKLFREIADFVGHNDKRNKGIANKSLKYLYLRMKFFNQYESPKKSLDISKPFPIWIRQLMLLQIEKSDEAKLMESFGMGIEQMKTRVQKGFKCNDKKGMVFLKEGKLSHETFQALQHVMSYLISKPSFSQTSLIKETVEVIKHNGLEINQDAFESQGKKIILCIFLLIHNTEFEFDGHKPGYCKISADKNSVFYPNDSPAESFGNLQLLGCISLQNNGKEVDVCHPLMESDLKVEEFCDKSLFSVSRINEKQPSLNVKKVLFDDKLILADTFKLKRLI